MADIDAYLVDQLYERLKTVIGDREINAGTIISITALVMMTVERQKNATGDEKKALALALLHKLADDAEMEKEEDRAGLHTLIDAVAPGAIDTIISASKKEFDLNKAKSHWLWFRKNCCCCCPNNAQ